MDSGSKAAELRGLSTTTAANAVALIWVDGCPVAEFDGCDEYGDEQDVDHAPASDPSSARYVTARCLRWSMASPAQENIAPDLDDQDDDRADEDDYRDGVGPAAASSMAPETMVAACVRPMLVISMTGSAIAAG